MSNTTIAGGSSENVTVSESIITGSVAVDGEVCQLWRPSGLVPPNLYNFKITLVDEGQVLAKWLQDHCPEHGTDLGSTARARNRTGKQLALRC